MKKKLSVSILILTMLVACLSVNAMAASGSAGTGEAAGNMTGAEFLAKEKEGIITLTDDVTITSGNVVANNKVLKINLGSHDLTLSSGAIATANNAVLTIEGSGEIRAANTLGEYGIVALVQANSTLNLNGGKIISDSATKTALQVQAGGTANINGGAIEGSADSIVRVMGDKANLTLEKGTITSTGEGNCAVAVQGDGSKTGTGGPLFEVKGGTVSSKGEAVSINNINGGGVEAVCFKMSGGELKQEAGATGSVVIIADAAAEITGGTVTGSGDGACAVQVGASGTETSGSVGHPGKLTVSGGTVKAEGEKSFGIYACQLNTEDAGKVTSVVISNDARVSGKETGVGAGTGANVAIEGGAVNGRYGATAGDGGKLTVSGGTVNGTTAGLGTNGSDENPDTSITVTGGDISGDIVGTYLPAGTMTVSGETAKISGKAGIVVRGGDLTVESGKIEAGGTDAVTIGDASKEGHTYTVPAAAITVDNAGYPAQEKGQKHVTIGGEAVLFAVGNGRTLAACENGDLIEPDETSQKVDPEKNPFDIQGGTFTVGDESTGDGDSVDQFLPENAKLNENGTGIIINGSPVAEVNGVHYTSLTEAVRHAEAGQTVTLLADAEIDAFIEITKEITVDIGEFDITRTGDAGSTVFSIKDGGSLTVNGTAGTVSVADTANASKNPVIAVDTNGELTVNGGTIKAINENASAVQLGASAKATVTGGEITGGRIGISAFEKAELTVAGGTVHGRDFGVSTNGSTGGPNKGNDAKITVTGGEISGGVAGMYLPAKDGVTAVTGGEISGQYGIVVRGGTIGISGDTTKVTATGTTPGSVGDSGSKELPVAAVVVDSDSHYGDVSANISGGTFASESDNSVVYTKEGVADSDPDNDLVITGGTFTVKNEADKNIEKYLEPNLTTDAHGTVEPAENIVVAVPNARGDAEGVITVVDNENGVFNVTVGGTVSTSRKNSTGVNDWWVGIGFVRPGDNVKSVKYKIGAEGEETENTPALDAWTLDGVEYRGFTFWADAGSFPADGFDIELEWFSDENYSESVCTTRYHLTADGLTTAPINGNIVDFGYAERGLDAAARAKINNEAVTGADWVDQTMWVTFAEPIPNGEQIDLVLSFNGGQAKADGDLVMNCIGDGKARTFAWSFLNNAQTEGVRARAGTYTVGSEDAVLTGETSVTVEKLPEEAVLFAKTTNGSADYEKENMTVTVMENDTVGQYYEVRFDTAKLAQTEASGNQGTAYWLGWALKAPEGAAKYAMTHTGTETALAAPASPNGTVNTDTPVEEDIDADHSKGVAMYYKADDPNPDYGWIAVTWTDVNGRPMGTTFVHAVFGDITFKVDDFDAQIGSVGFKVDRDEANEAILAGLEPEKQESFAGDCVDNTMYIVLDTRAAAPAGKTAGVKVTRDGTEIFEHTLPAAPDEGNKVVYFSFDDQAKEKLAPGEYLVELIVDGKNVDFRTLKIYEIKYVSGEGVEEFSRSVFADENDLETAMAAEKPQVRLSGSNNTLTWSEAVEDGFTVTYTATGSYVSSSVPSAPITSKVEKTGNGSVKLSSTTAGAGKTVTVTVTPDEDYEVGSVTVTDRNGGLVEVTENGDGTYSYVMPERALQPVTVRVVFTHICPSRDFADLDLNEWYHGDHAATDYVLSRRLMIGTGIGFEPNKTITRAEAWTILARMSVPGFETATGADWYKGAQEFVMTAGENRDAISDGTNPDSTVTREQFVVMIWRAKDAPESRQDLSAFTDADAVSDWNGFIPAMKWAVENSVITGKPGDRLDPQGELTRAEMAAILYRIGATLAAEK